MVTVCCVCKKTKNKNRWQKQAIIHGKVLSHGYCPHCYELIINKLHNLEAQSKYHDNP
ncbi:MAG: hypothetical protein OEY01_01980 [Desulfobulbaceae bacterium]|nr:hypothetical protein [Desulfobulbaceae bacterium]HIJ78061.1 hypothetical protein [Deltaproteobacteria bacterium]